MEMRIASSPLPPISHELELRLLLYITNYLDPYLRYFLEATKIRSERWVLSLDLVTLCTSSYEKEGCRNTCSFDKFNNPELTDDVHFSLQTI